MRIRIIAMAVLVAALVAACQPDPMMTDNGRLVGEQPPDQGGGAPTLFLPPTSTPLIVPTSPPVIVPTQSAPTEVAGVAIATADNQFIVVSPTELPSKTPSVTPTQSAVPSQTTTPTITVTVTSSPTSEQFSFRGGGQSSAQEATAYAVNLQAQQQRATQQAVVSAQNAFVPAPPGDFPPPPSDGGGAPPPAGNAGQQNSQAPAPGGGPVVSNGAANFQPASVCGANGWFAGDIRVETCPVNGADSSNAAFQRFQYGYMFWLEKTDRVYAFVLSGGAPRWASYPDTWQPTDPECQGEDAVNVADQQAWTPVQGFCSTWTQDGSLRNALGYAEDRYEFSYVARYQAGEGGSIAIEDNVGNVFYGGAGGGWSLTIR
ncbi:MAG: hypothetical protein AAFU54_04085 [Chloroflexota bacterium]